VARWMVLLNYCRIISIEIIDEIHKMWGIINRAFYLKCIIV